jgi:DNA-3-methyladenine glycosylase II
MYEVTCTCAVAPPFRLDLTVWVLRRRAKNVIDRWDGQLYTRILTLGKVPVELTVPLPFTPPGHTPAQLPISLRSNVRLSAEQVAEATATVQKMLGLGVDVRPFYKLAEQNKVLARLAEPFVGVRPPRFPTVFEALVNAIACQQVSLDAGIAVLGRLTQTYGAAFTGASGTMHAFPRPEDLLDVPDENLRQLGFSYQTARTIQAVAYIAAADDWQLGRLETVSTTDVLAQLQSIRGIGRWSAEYVLLRGLGRLDVFPGDDIGGQNNVQKLLGLSARPAYGELKALSAAWHPYAGFVYFHLLLTKLRENKLV